LVFFYDGAIVILSLYVDLGEVLLSSKLVDDVFNEWQEILARYCPLVKLSVVLYRL